MYMLKHLVTLTLAYYKVSDIDINWLKTKENQTFIT